MENGLCSGRGNGHPGDAALGDVEATAHRALMREMMVVCQSFAMGGMA